MRPTPQPSQLSPEPSMLGARGLHASPSGRGKLGMSLLRDNFSQLCAEFEAWQGSKTPPAGPGGGLSKAASAELPASVAAAEPAPQAQQRRNSADGATPRGPKRPPAAARKAADSPAAPAAPAAPVAPAAAQQVGPGAAAAAPAASSKPPPHPGKHKPAKQASRSEVLAPAVAGGAGHAVAAPTAPPAALCSSAPAEKQTASSTAAGAATAAPPGALAAMVSGSLDPATACALTAVKRLIVKRINSRLQLTAAKEPQAVEAAPEAPAPEAATAVQPVQQQLEQRQASSPPPQQQTPPQQELQAGTLAPQADMAAAAAACVAARQPGALLAEESSAASCSIPPSCPLLHQRAQHRLRQGRQRVATATSEGSVADTDRECAGSPAGGRTSPSRIPARSLSPPGQRHKPAAGAAAPASHIPHIPAAGSSPAVTAAQAADQAGGGAAEAPVLPPPRPAQPQQQPGPAQAQEEQQAPSKQATTSKPAATKAAQQPKAAPAAAEAGAPTVPCSSGSAAPAWPRLTSEPTTPRTGRSQSSKQLRQTPHAPEAPAPTGSGSSTARRHTTDAVSVEAAAAQGHAGMAGALQHMKQLQMLRMRAAHAAGQHDGPECAPQHKRATADELLGRPGAGKLRRGTVSAHATNTADAPGQVPVGQPLRPSNRRSSSPGGSGRDQGEAAASAAGAVGSAPGLQAKPAMMERLARLKHARVPSAAHARPAAPPDEDAAPAAEAAAAQQQGGGRGQRRKYATADYDHDGHVILGPAIIERDASRPICRATAATSFAADPAYEPLPTAERSQYRHNSPGRSNQGSPTPGELGCDADAAQQQQLLQQQAAPVTGFGLHQQALYGLHQQASYTAAGPRGQQGPSPRLSPAGSLDGHSAGLAHATPAPHQLAAGLPKPPVWLMGSAPGLAWDAAAATQLQPPGGGNDRRVHKTLSERPYAHGNWQQLQQPQPSGDSAGAAGMLASGAAPIGALTQFEDPWAARMAHKGPSTSMLLRHTQDGGIDLSGSWGHGSFEAVLRARPVAQLPPFMRRPQLQSLGGQP